MKIKKKSRKNQEKIGLRAVIGPAVTWVVCNNIIPGYCKHHTG
jgi:hypothetical protein